MINLRSALLAAAAATVLSGSAFAADLAPRSVEPVAPVAAEGFNWTGFYAGLNGGYGFGSGNHAKVRESIAGVPSYSTNGGSLSPKGGFGGAQAGYNYQTGNIVLGLEGDIQGGSISDTARRTSLYAPYGVYDGSTFSSATKADVTWFGTVRPRVGFAFDNFLVYGTGGLAFGGVNLKQSVNLSDGYSSYNSKDTTRAGYVLGAGIEYAVTPNWTVKAEYQYIDLGKQNVAGSEYTDFGALTDASTTSKVRTDFHTIRLGVNYKF